MNKYGLKIIISAWKFHINRPQQTNYIIKTLLKRQDPIVIFSPEISRKQLRYSKEYLTSSSQIFPINNTLKIFRKLSNKLAFAIGSHKIRRYQEELYDKFVSENLKKDAKLFFVDLSSSLYSIRKAHSYGIRSIVHEQMAHPAFNYRLLKEECIKWNVKLHDEFMENRMMERRKKVLEESDAIVTLSHSVAAKSLIENGISKEKIHVVPLGVDSKYFCPEIVKNRKFQVLFVGNGSIIKGLPYLLKAWGDLDIKDAELIICGKHNPKLIKRFKVLNNVHFEGVVNPLTYYQASSVFIQPSISDAFSRSVLEAMACGLPVIISEGVGACDIIKDGEEGFIISARDVEDIIEKIRFLYTDEGRRSEMGLKARETAERYEWRKYGDKVVNIIKEYF